MRTSSATTTSTARVPHPGVSPHRAVHLWLLGARDHGQLQGSFRRRTGYCPMNEDGATARASLFANRLQPLCLSRQLARPQVRAISKIQLLPTPPGTKTMSDLRSGSTFQWIAEVCFGHSCIKEPARKKQGRGLALYDQPQPHQPGSQRRNYLPGGVRKGYCHNIIGNYP
jgi:hypothetical protein